MIYKKNGEKYLIQRPNPLLSDTCMLPKNWTHGIAENISNLGDIFSPTIGDIAVKNVSDFFDVSFEDKPQLQEGIVSVDTDDTSDVVVTVDSDTIISEKNIILDDDDYFDKDFVIGGKDKEMIKNPDGTPYKLPGSMETFNMQNPDLKYINSQDAEYIRLSGAPIEYYRVIVDQNIDHLYMEQREKVYLQTPIVMYSIYEPVAPVLSYLGVGFSSDDEMTFHFNRSEFIDKTGELPREGSLIKTLDEGVWWSITNVIINSGDRMMWGKFRVSVNCTKYQANAGDSSPSMLGKESRESGNNPINIE